MKNMLLPLLFLTLVPTITNISMAQWVPTNNPSGEITALAVSGTNLFVAIEAMYQVEEGEVVYDYVFSTSDNGTSWNEADSGLTGMGRNITSFVVTGPNIFAGTDDNGAYRSTNNGRSWTPVDSGLTNLSVYFLGTSPNGTNGTNIFAGTWGGDVFLSTNNGVNWTAVDSSVTNFAIGPFAVIGPNLFAGTSDNGVYLTTNNGKNWNPVNTGLTSTAVTSLAVIGTNLFAGTIGGGVFLSTNNGTNWANVGLTNISIATLAVSGKNLFAGSESLGGVYLSTNNGASWSAVDTGLTSADVDTLIFYPLVEALAVSDMNIFAGTNGGLFKRPLSEMVTSISKISKDIPSQFILNQNYPNPFNPTTAISFTLPSRSFVSLKVFDMLGREISTMVSGELEPGSYTRQWNGANMASGIYFYRLQAGTYTETKRLLLLK